jgi:pimeloyl-ACP methyl ester carboxylesterase
MQMALQTEMQTEMQSVAIQQGVVSFCEENRAAPSDSKAPWVLLHGIGSSSGSWRAQFVAAKLTRQRLLAWDAPGYGQSTNLSQTEPNAGNYATQMWAWLDAIGVHQPVRLVGHSLGALMAASAALQHPKRVEQLVLLSPALGYAGSSADERHAIIQKRLDNLATLGPTEMAKARAPAMLSKNASSEMLAQVEAMMAAVQPVGYGQAVHMLANANLLADLKSLRERFPEIRIRVGCGSEDQITPLSKCTLAAKVVGSELINLGPVGHACAIEAPEIINQLLEILQATSNP